MILKTMQTWTELIFKATKAPELIISSYFFNFFFAKNYVLLRDCSYYYFSHNIFLLLNEIFYKQNIKHFS